MKTCTKCGESKPLEAFYRSDQHRCAECNRIKSKNYTAKNRGLVRYKAMELRALRRDIREVKRSLGIPLERSQLAKLEGVWWEMKRRCNIPHNPAYSNYGGRGISVEFRDWSHFREWSLASGYGPGLEIDRIDNDGNYSPDNCRWVTRSVNARNTRRNQIVTAFGESKTRAEWLRDPRVTVSQTTLRWRLVNGWSPEDALTRPPNRKFDPMKGTE